MSGPLDGIARPPPGLPGSRRAGGAPRSPPACSWRP